MLGSHNGTIVLTLESIFHSEEVSRTLIIKSVDDNEITMAYWLRGIEYELKATKWKRKSAREKSREMDNLIRQAWRIQEEIIPPPIDITGLMDLGCPTDDFEEIEDLVYHKDSNLLISQEDIDNHSLILKFDKTGVYKVYRESRLLDEGKWSMQFNNTVIQFESNRKAYEVDGTLRGFIEIKKLKRSQLIIRREFQNQLNYGIDRDNGLWEIYKLVR